MASSWTRDWTCVSWVTRETHEHFFLGSPFNLVQPVLPDICQCQKTCWLCLPLPSYTHTYTQQTTSATRAGLCVFQNHNSMLRAKWMLHTPLLMGGWMNRWTQEGDGTQTSFMATISCNFSKWQCLWGAAYRSPGTERGHQDILKSPFPELIGKKSFFFFLIWV